MATLLEARGIRKSFGPTRALDGVDLRICPGEVHALIGENGAGKSTLMNVLSGALRPDSGDLRWEGTPWQPAHPREARDRGLAMIYQELNLAPDLSVEDNLLLGHWPSRWGWISPARRRARAREALELIGHPELIDHPRAGSLSNARQQLIEIARAILLRPRLLILDEPTSSLGRADAEHLFDLIDRLRNEGVAVIYISHYLEECRRVAQHYTVLRDGRSVGGGALANTSDREILRTMVGRDVQSLYPDPPPPPTGPVLLETRNLSGPHLPRNLSLSLRGGEIFGLFGLMGSGRTETVRTLFGLDRCREGEVILLEQPPGRIDPRSALARGMGYLSEDRKGEGLLLNRSVADNLTLTRTRPFRKWGWLSRRKQLEAARHWMEQLGIRARDSDQTPVELSGGNQQKVALGRLAHHQARILLLDEPTRGIDLGSKQQIYPLIRQWADEGRAILLISSYLPELLALSTTIGVLNRGHLVEVRPRPEWDETALIAAATRTLTPKQEPSASPATHE